MFHSIEKTGTKCLKDLPKILETEGCVFHFKMLQWSISFSTTQSVTKCSGVKVKTLLLQFQYFSEPTKGMLIAVDKDNMYIHIDDIFIYYKIKIIYFLCFNNFYAHAVPYSCHSAEVEKQFAKLTVRYVVMGC